MLLLPMPILPEYSWPTKILIVLINWVGWVIPAGEEAFAYDVGSYYQGTTAALLVLGVSLPILEAYGLYSLLEQNALLVGIACAVSTYLLAGALYFLHRRQWSM